ncbi:MAG: enoyl-CoA hydratase/isomerase family protein, partial [Solirubrobacterales bacterium]
SGRFLMAESTGMPYREVVEAARSHPGRFIEVERHPDVRSAVIRLIEPDLMNPLSPPLLIQLIDNIDDLTADPELRSIILTGTDPGFCVGGDFRVMQTAIDAMRIPVPEGAVGIWRFIRYLFGGIARRIVRSDQAFIAAVNGETAGVGWAFTLASDHIICSDRAKIVPAFSRLGLVPEVGTSWLLTRRLGYQGALDLYTSGEVVDGEKAVEIGLAQRCVPHQELIEASLDRARGFAELPGHALQMAKPMLRQAADMTWEQAITMEEFAEPLTFTTEHFAQIISSLRPEDGGRDNPGWPPSAWESGQ